MLQLLLYNTNKTNKYIKHGNHTYYCFFIPYDINDRLNTIIARLYSICIKHDIGIYINI